VVADHFNMHHDDAPRQHHCCGIDAQANAWAMDKWFAESAGWVGEAQ
jgi:hypothetical protein